MKLVKKISTLALGASIVLGAGYSKKSEALIVGLAASGTGLVIAGGAAALGGSIGAAWVGESYGRHNAWVHTSWFIAIAGLALDGDSLDLSSSKLATIEEQLEKNGYFKARGQREKIMAELKHFSNAIDAFEKGQTAVCQNYELKDCAPKALSIDLLPLKNSERLAQVASVQKSIQDHYGFLPSETVTKVLLDLNSSLSD